jgi:hypothetical protein
MVATFVGALSPYAQRIRGQEVLMDGTIQGLFFKGRGLCFIGIMER